MATECTCVPCTTPGQLGHCAECCMGTMIEEYDHGCPVPEHEEMAVRQWGAYCVHGVHYNAPCDECPGVERDTDPLHIAIDREQNQYEKHLDSMGP